jgi:ERCC4-type nuclease
MNYNQVEILANDRESDSGVVPILRSLNVQIKIKRLAVGDYLINNKVLFERKSLPDLVASIKDGRLFYQAAKLASFHLPAIIILEGTAKDLASQMGSRNPRNCWIILKQYAPSVLQMSLCLLLWMALALKMQKPFTIYFHE